MHQAETVVFLFAFVAVMVIVARKLSIAYPIVLLLAGLALSFVPHLPPVRLNPDVVFFFFLPPLIYPSALFTSWREFRRNLRPILLLAIGLVLATTVTIAIVAHGLVPSFSWPAAFALGAIVSPPDAIAATAILQRLSVPHRIAVVLEGESLVNDATALVALQFAVAAVMTGRFSLTTAAAQFLLVAAGGVGIGLIIGALMRWIHQHLDDPPVQITLSLLTPFTAYLTAEHLHVSGILAVVTAGIFLGWHSPVIVSARYRLQSFAFWEMVVFLLNGFVFVSIGLQLPGILHALAGESVASLMVEALLITTAVVLVRIAWVFPATYLPRFLVKRIRSRDPYPGWRNVAVVAWAGMRGVISLAAAFALPFTTSTGAPFPARNYILFFTFCVILVTLGLQGLTLPPLIRFLRIRPDTALEDEERTARVEANKAALELLAKIADENKPSPEIVNRLRAEYQERLEQLRVCAETPTDRRGEVATPQYQQLRYNALKRERETIIRLRNEQVINDDALRRIQRDLDLAEAQLDHVVAR